MCLRLFKKVIVYIHRFYFCNDISDKIIIRDSGEKEQCKGICICIEYW